MGVLNTAGATSLRMVKRVLPGSAYAKLRRWAREHLPVRLQSRLKAIEQKAGGRRHELMCRQDALFSLLEQRLERLESLLFGRMGGLEDSLDARVTDLLKRQDSMVMMLEQRLENLESFIGSRPNPHDDEFDLLTPDQYQRFQQHFHNSSAKENHLIQLIQDHISPGSRVLEIGSGDGLFLRLLDHHGCDSIGVDSNHEMVNSCRSDGLTVLEEDGIEYLKRLPDESLDVVVGLHVVEHLSNRLLSNFVRESYRALRPSGKIIIETPKIASLFCLTQYYFLDPTHRLPRHHGLVSFLLQDTGFANVSVHDVVSDHNQSDEHPALISQAQQAQGHHKPNGSDNCESDVEQLVAECRHDFEVLEDWLFVARDVLLVAQKPEVTS